MARVVNVLTQGFPNYGKRLDFKRYPDDWSKPRVVFGHSLFSASLHLNISQPLLRNVTSSGFKIDHLHYWKHDVKKHKTVLGRGGGGCLWLIIRNVKGYRLKKQLGASAVTYWLAFCNSYTVIRVTPLPFSTATHDIFAKFLLLGANSFSKYYRYFHQQISLVYIIYWSWKKGTHCRLWLTTLSKSQARQNAV